MAGRVRLTWCGYKCVTGGPAGVVRVARGPATWAKRAFVAVVLVGAAVIPGRASSGPPQHCTGIRCSGAGSTLWTAALPGLWVAAAGVSGTVPAKVGAYAATGGGLAVIGAGSAVSGYDERTGKRLWRVPLTDLPAGSAVVGVRAFPGVVAVGLAPPPGQSLGSEARAGQSTRGNSGPSLAGAGRYEVMLSAATGRQIRIYPAATYGGAVAANAATSVIVGARAVTAYDNATGTVRWSRAIGGAGQSWRVSGDTMYVTDGDGSPGAAGPTELRRIDLRTGAQKIVPLHVLAGASPGSLSDAIGNVVLFSGADTVRAYSGVTGYLLWHRPDANLELADGAKGDVYLASGSKLLGVAVSTHRVISTAPISVAASLYSVSNGVALGLDENGLGEAWGYNLQTRRIAWTTGSLAWPHFFVDLSGLGGSVSPGSTIALLATCANVGSPATPNAAPVCSRPELEAVRI